MKHYYIFFTLFIFSCSTNTYNFYDGYPEVRIIKYLEGVIYESIHTGKDTLIISLPGYTDGSSLGYIDSLKKHPVATDFWYYYEYFGDSSTIIIPEKEYTKPGQFHGYDKKYLENYTIDNLIKHYTILIDEYLDNTSIDNIILSGNSEGGLILPIIYSSLRNKKKINKIVCMFAGGMFLYDYNQFDTVYGPAGMRDIWWDDIDKNPESIEKQFHGMTYRYVYSWKNYSPIEYYEFINIPVLFVNGRLDTIIPIETVRAIEQKYPAKPFTYLCYDNMGHNPINLNEIQTVMNDIKEWIFQ